VLSLKVKNPLLIIKMSPSTSSTAYFPAPDAVIPSSILDAEKNGITGKYVADIINCYNALVNLPHLQPCLTVNKAFSELMVICTQIPEDSIVHAVCTSSGRSYGFADNHTRSSQTHRSRGSGFDFNRFVHAESAISRSTGLRR
jgi:hypothetical protein